MRALIVLDISVVQIECKVVKAHCCGVLEARDRR